jgi:AcrR family transcriptional regulator
MPAAKTLMRRPSASKKKAVRSKPQKLSGTTKRVPSMRDQVHAFKREQIIGVAAELFYAVGYQQTTLDHIAQRLGVTKPFIYYHFREKADLLLEISKRGITNGNDILRRALVAQGAPTERLRGAICEVVRTIVHSQRYTAIFFREQKNFDAKVREPLEAMHSEFDELLAELLEQGVKRREFRIEDLRLCSLAIGGMVNWAYTWYREDGRLSVDQLCEGMAELALKLAGADTLALAGTPT